MEPIIKSLILKNFRSFKEERIDFDNPTFVVGRNGSGKSNLVDALSLISEAMTSPLRAVFEKRGGASSIGYRLPYKNQPPVESEFGISIILSNFNYGIRECRYGFEIRYLHNQFKVIHEQCYIENVKSEISWFEKRPGFFNSTIQGINPVIDDSSLVMPIIGAAVELAPIVNFLAAIKVYSIIPSKIREPQDPDNGFLLKSDGSNAASVIAELSKSEDRLHALCGLLSLVAPNIVGVLHLSQGSKLNINFIQEYGNGEKAIFEALHMSDGTLRALGLLLTIFQDYNTSLLVFEEPEATLHFSALSSLLDLIRDVSKYRQILITTHSNDLLDSKDILGNNLRISEWSNGCSRIRKIDQSSQQILKEHLMVPGELIRSYTIETAKEKWAPNDLKLFQEIKT